MDKIEWGVNTVSASSPYGLTDFSSEYTPRARKTKVTREELIATRAVETKWQTVKKKGGKRG